MGANETKKLNSTFESVVTIRGGRVAHITGGYIVHPKVNFGGGTVKWFDDRKLLKGGTVV